MISTKEIYSGSVQNTHRRFKAIQVLNYKFKSVGLIVLTLILSVFMRALLGLIPVSYLITLEGKHNQFESENVGNGSSTEHF